MGSPVVSPQDPRRVPAPLRDRYDVQGPRYTSYPPANHFGPIDRVELLRRWRGRSGLGEDPGLSVYVHVPFCLSRCHFCGCHTTVGATAEAMARYVDALCAETDLALAEIGAARPVRQVALGGGTPHALPLAELRRLLEALAARFAFAEDAELSVELDPRRVSPEAIDLFLDAGFGRFSLGVQDLDPSVLRAIGRATGPGTVEGTAARLWSRGEVGLNVDLVYGLPGQSLATAAETIRRVLELRPSRVATYGYAHVPWVRPSQAALEALERPGPALRLELFLAWSDALIAAGYLPIGMDHFALPDDPLALALEGGTLRRGFMGYTDGRGLDVLGLGASAISSIGASYSQDEKDVGAYVEAVLRGRLPVVRGHLLSEDDELRRELLLDLFCTFEADLDELGRRLALDAAMALSSDIARLAPLVEDGLVRLDGSRIVVTPLGRFFVRNVCMVFDRYLDRPVGASVYSRTV